MSGSKMHPLTEMCLRIFGWIVLELIGGLIYLLYQLFLYLIRL